MAPRNRTALGREFTVSSRAYGWLSADAVELDVVEGYDVTRRRVLLDEVLLVTLHRAWRPALLFTMALGALGFGLPALLARRDSASQAVLLCFFAPFLLAFLGHLALGTDYVTVAGRRSRARLAFNFRKARAREIFELLAQRVEVAQAAARAAATPPAGAPAGDAPAAPAPAPAPADAPADSPDAPAPAAGEERATR